MSGDKRSARLVKFWWVLAATIGAAVGALSDKVWGLAYCFWAIAGIGIPIALAVAFVERSGPHGRAPRTTRGAGLRMHQPAGLRRRDQFKGFPRRAKLHAIVGRKRAEPPSSSGGA